MRLLKLILTLVIVITGLLGDNVVFRSKYSNSQLFRAVADTTVHAAIGFLSACLFFSHRLNIPLQTCLYSILFCTVISSIIDVDHFFVAKSIYLKDITNLNQRGILHCTTFGILITTALLTYSYITKKLNINLLANMLILAFSSHHLRDGNRRGLWIYLYGHTVAINKYVYLILSAILPHIVAYAFVCTKHVFSQEYKPVETV